MLWILALFVVIVVVRQIKSKSTFRLRLIDLASMLLLMMSWSRKSSTMLLLLLLLLLSLWWWWWSWWRRWWRLKMWRRPSRRSGAMTPSLLKLIEVIGMEFMIWSLLTSSLMAVAVIDLMVLLVLLRLMLLLLPLMLLLMPLIILLLMHLLLMLLMLRWRLLIERVGC
jgi:hypothetical protein